jgi:hypothetical protein
LCTVLLTFLGVVGIIQYTLGEPADLPLPEQSWDDCGTWEVHTQTELNARNGKPRVIEVYRICIE